MRYRQFGSSSPVPNCEGVKCRDMVYILSPDILYSLPMAGGKSVWSVKRRRALLESNLAEE
jgi:hypothetical protein